jgi:hypothetical protein
LFDIEISFTYLKLSTSFTVFNVICAIIVTYPILGRMTND